MLKGCDSTEIYWIGSPGSRRPTNVGLDGLKQASRPREHSFWLTKSIMLTNREWICIITCKTKGVRRQGKESTQKKFGDTPNPDGRASFPKSRQVRSEPAIHKIRAKNWCWHLHEGKGRKTGKASKLIGDWKTLRVNVSQGRRLRMRDLHNQVDFVSYLKVNVCRIKGELLLQDDPFKVTANGKALIVLPHWPGFVIWYYKGNLWKKVVLVRYEIRFVKARQSK